MLETIQEFALECLENSDEIDIIRRRHAQYFVSLAEQAEPEFKKTNQARWYKRIEIELDNIRTVFHWALGGADPQLGVQLLVTLDDFWTFRTYQFEM